MRHRSFPVEASNAHGLYRKSRALHAWFCVDALTCWLVASHDRNAMVKKNGIMMVDFAVAAQQQGKTALEAIHEACLVRFRPIMMTTMAALVGTLPIALGLGAGAESRRPLGLAVVGGLLVSQLLTLYITPVYYVYMDKAQRGFVRKPARHAEPQPAGVVQGIARIEQRPV